MKKLLVALVAAFGASAMPATACQPPPWFDHAQAAIFHSLPSIYARAATIDRVVIEAPRAPCSRDEAEECEIATPFKARVVERLKGKSPALFNLVLAPRDAEVEWRAIRYPKYPNGSEGFIDLRTVRPDIAAREAARMKARADNAHAPPSFRVDERLAPNSHPVWACGPVWVMDDRFPQLVFRDAAGLVIGVEAVTRDDDKLLARLRRAKSGPL